MHNIKFIFLLLLLSLLVGCSQQLKVGDTVPPYPNSLQHYGSSCIGDLKGYKNCEFSLGIYQSHANKFYLIIDEFQRRDESGRAIWKVKNFVISKKVSKNSVVVSGICRVNGVENEAVIATVPVHDGNSPEYIQAAGWAYKYELPSGAFTEISTNSVSCYNTAKDAD